MGMTGNIWKELSGHGPCYKRTRPSSLHSQRPTWGVMSCPVLLLAWEQLGYFKASLPGPSMHPTVVMRHLHALWCPLVPGHQLRGFSALLSAV